MKALTLTSFINEQLKDEEFATLYAKEQVINNIAKMIVDARKKGHLTQSELAEKSGTTQSVISRIESGSGSFIPSLQTLLRISLALNMKLQLRMN